MGRAQSPGMALCCLAWSSISPGAPFYLDPHFTWILVLPGSPFLRSSSIPHKQSLVLPGAAQSQSLIPSAPCPPRVQVL